MHGDLRGILVGCKHLLQQGAQLCLAEHTARLDVAEQVLEVAHALGQRLHLAQALVHHLQPVGHLAEALAQALVQRGLELFVHSLAHLVELGAVGVLHLRHLRFQRAAHFLQAARVGFAQGIELAGERVGHLLLHTGKAALHALQLLLQQLGVFGQTGLQRAVQRFAHQAAHLVELLRIALRQASNLLVQRAAYLVHALLVAFMQAGQALVERVLHDALHLRQLLGKALELRPLRTCRLGGMLHQRALEGTQRLRVLLPAGARRLGQLAAQLTLQPLIAFADAVVKRIAQRLQRLALRTVIGLAQ